MYNQKVTDYFSNPRNMGELKDADIVAEGGNPTCGDVVKLWIKLDHSKKNIEKATFQAFGCGACIASTSALTEMVAGKSVQEAKNITNKEIAEYLGGLPPQKNLCSNFSADILKKGLEKISN